MQGKYWSNYQKAHHIEIGGVCWLLDHLLESSFVVDVPAIGGFSAVKLTIQVEYSSHCISRGPKQNETIDFQTLGYEYMVIDHRRVKRAFHPGRHALSFLLPKIVESFALRKCFFTGRENFLTLELGNLTEGYDKNAKYEIYFNIRQTKTPNQLKLFIESAYVRDNDADNAPVNFKKADKIAAWKLFVKKARGEAAKPARNSFLKPGTKKQTPS